MNQSEVSKLRLFSRISYHGKIYFLTSYESTSDNECLQYEFNVRRQLACSYNLLDVKYVKGYNEQDLTDTAYINVYLNDVAYVGETDEETKMFYIVKFKMSNIKLLDKFSGGTFIEKKKIYLTKVDANDLFLLFHLVPKLNEFDTMFVYSLAQDVYEQKFFNLGIGLENNVYYLYFMFKKNYVVTKRPLNFESDNSLEHCIATMIKEQALFDIDSTVSNNVVIPLECNSSALNTSKEERISFVADKIISWFSEINVYTNPTLYCAIRQLAFTPIINNTLKPFVTHLVYKYCRVSFNDDFLTASLFDDKMISETITCIRAYILKTFASNPCTLKEFVTAVYLKNRRFNSLPFMKHTVLYGNGHFRCKISVPKSKWVEFKDATSLLHYYDTINVNTCIAVVKNYMGKCENVKNR